MAANGVNSMSTTLASFEDANSICTKGERGLILPVFGDYEQEWPRGLRVFIYLCGLAWCFLGVAIVSDVFMGAIETITAKKMARYDPVRREFIQVLVWNGTVANLTLMALGSSAPEILLSCIELFQGDFFAGDLGPSTIVGSAAFNLLCISAVCVSGIPGEEPKKIKDVPVYVVTATFSLFAYFWLYFILKIHSENIVEVWEGILTFLFFPILVVLAFWVDKGRCCRPENDDETSELHIGPDISSEELAALDASIRLEGPMQNLSDQEIVKIVQSYCQPTWSRAMYHVRAVRDITAGHRLQCPSETPAPNVKQVVPFDGGTVGFGSTEKPEVDKEKVYVEFAVARCAVLENCEEVELEVIVRGEVTRPITVAYRTREGTAKPKTDYIHKEGHLVFEPGETKSKVITVVIVDDKAYEDEEDFYVDLLLDTFPAYNIALGDPCTATVVIIDDDQPGNLSLPWERIDVHEGKIDKVIDIMVQRKDGIRGRVGCSYHTEDDTAVAGTDYLPTSGKLELDDGQVQAKIPVTIKARGKYEKHGAFRLVLKDPWGGTEFETSHGSKNMCVCVISVMPDPANKHRIDKMMSILRVDWARAKVGHEKWPDQFRAALLVNGGEEDTEATVYDWAMHIISLPWKLLFAFVPPTECCGGWVCFVVALLMIGGVTAVVGDMAALLGCVLDVPDEITAITFVALGTSLPDTFASKTAAQQDKYADASVGNVTGSNSVNVFLGLGLPWMIAALYWDAGINDEWRRRYLRPNKDGNILGENHPEGAFIVEAGALGFSVSVFTGCALAAIALLAIRRKCVGGELGGPRVLKYCSSALLFCFWLVYIGLSCWQVLDNED